MPGPRRALLAAAVLLLVVGAPATGAAQVFLASQPHPEFAIGPLFVNVVVRPDLAPATVTVSWSLTAPRHRRAADIREDLYLLWPAELAEATAPGPADPELIAYVEQRSFAVVGSGRLTLAARDRLQMGTGTPATPLPEAASYVTFVRRAAPQLGVGTYVKIPWTRSWPTRSP